MKYYLAEANQNTFILYDFLDKQSVDQKLLNEVQKALLFENRDDALLLVNGSEKKGAFIAQMLVLGQDGQLGEFCGNGARACGAYLFDNYPHAKQHYLITPYGLHPLQKYDEDVYSINLPAASFEIDSKFIADPQTFRSKYPWIFVNMIEPHLTLEGEMSDQELYKQGRELNTQRDLFPLGINLNVWQIQRDGTLFVKTFERGVQRLTRSCGTGSLSCASIYKSQGHVRVITPGGPLDICLGVSGIELKGSGYYSKQE
ncbi:MAG: hypothetical protein WC222_05235 [Parachlamydiales bacterium]|jgi:diaminopimelate epimerase